MCFSVWLSKSIVGSRATECSWTRSPMCWLRKFPCSPPASLFLLPRSNYGASYPRFGFTPVRAYYGTLSPSTSTSFYSFHQQDIPDFRVDQFTCLLPRVAVIALIFRWGYANAVGICEPSYRCRIRCFLWSLTHDQTHLAPVPLLALGLIAPCFQLRSASLTFWLGVDRSGVITLL